ncbi:hypothetical protein [Streptomyces sp. NPDC055189]
MLLTSAVAGTGMAAAPPASAGGIGDFLSPAFGTSCANHRTGGHMVGRTAYGEGSADSNLLGLPVSSPVNQCGGADLPGELDEAFALRGAGGGNYGIVKDLAFGVG